MRRSAGWWRRRIGDERGSQIVEFALALPLLLVILSAIAEFGLLFRTAAVVANAAREGARLAAIPGNQANNYSTVRARVADYLGSHGANAAAPVVITPVSLPIGAAASATGVQVTVNYTYDCLFLDPIIGLINGTFAGTVTFGSSAVMRTQVGAS